MLSSAYDSPARHFDPHSLEPRHSGTSQVYTVASFYRSIYRPCTVEGDSPSRRIHRNSPPDRHRPSWCRYTACPHTGSGPHHRCEYLAKKNNVKEFSNDVSEL